MDATFGYNGYAMRSHSETRWAAMMDHCGIRWLYEPKVYQTREGGYLPDFYLPDAGCFLEVKGPAPTEEERAKADGLEEVTGLPVIFAYGTPKLDGIFLGNAFLAYRKTRVPVYRICEGMNRHFGLASAARFAMVGRMQHHGLYDVSDLLQPVLMMAAGRGYVEKLRRREHAPLNQAKLVAHNVPPLPAMFVGMCIARLRKTESIQQTSTNHEHVHPDDSVHRARGVRK